MKGYIYSGQGVLFGEQTLVGFGADAFRVEEIPRKEANDVIMANHYSKKFYAASYVHLGLFAGQKLQGVLQYGYAMNPASMASVVEGTTLSQYLELNRMWVSDEMPRNSESKAISYSIKYIRRKLPDVAWIQSFADERCGRLGVVYQACSFLYCGEHVARFFELDGVFYHRSIISRRPELTKSSAYLQSRKKDCTEHKFRQFRYVKILKKWARRRLLLPVLPYPKPAAEDK